MEETCYRVIAVLTLWSLIATKFWSSSCVVKFFDRVDNILFSFVALFSGQFMIRVGRTFFICAVVCAISTSFALMSAFITDYYLLWQHIPFTLGVFLYMLQGSVVTGIVSWLVVFFYIRPICTWSRFMTILRPATKVFLLVAMYMLVSQIDGLFHRDCGFTVPKVDSHTTIISEPAMPVVSVARVEVRCVYQRTNRCHDDHQNAIVISASKYVFHDDPRLKPEEVVNQYLTRLLLAPYFNSIAASLTLPR